MDTQNTSDTILSIERALVILKRFADRKEEIGVRDLSRELGYSPAVTQKILNTLRVHDFVRQNSKTECYSLGLGVVYLGMAVLAQLDVVTVAKPYVAALTEETQETTFLAIRGGTSAIYVDKEISPLSIRMDAKIGSLRPVNCTAAGKIFLAFSDEDLITEAEKTGTLVKATPNSIVDPEELRKEINKVREQGFAIDNREFLSDAMCIAAPIFNQNGKIVATITTSGPVSRMEDQVNELITLVKEKAARISIELGFNK